MTDDVETPFAHFAPASPASIVPAEKRKRGPRRTMPDKPAVKEAPRPRGRPKANGAAQTKRGPKGAQTFKVDAAKLVPAMVGLKAEEAQLLLGCNTALGSLSKKGRQKVLVALAKIHS